jgi:hypothetical protein
MMLISGAALVVGSVILYAMPSRTGGPSSRHHVKT